MGRILWSKRRVSSAHLKSFNNHWEKNWTFFFQRLFKWWQIKHKCYQTIKKRRLTLLNHFCGWQRKYTLPIVYHSNTRAFYSHVSALLRQLPKSFFHIVWVEVEIQKAPELTALPQCSSCDHPLVYLQHPATGKLLRGTCKVLGTAHPSPAAEAKKYNWSVQIFKQDGASKH